MQCCLRNLFLPLRYIYTVNYHYRESVVDYITTPPDIILFCSISGNHKNHHSGDRPNRFFLPYIKFVFKKLDLESGEQAGIFPANPRTLFVGNSQSHRKSQRTCIKFIKSLMNIVNKVHLKVYKWKISTIILDIQMFQG